GGGIHIVPPEQLGAGEVRIALVQLLPQFAATNKAVRLLPELHLGQFGVVPAIRDDPVRGRGSAGDVSGLRGASESGEGWNNSCTGAGLFEGTDRRRMRADQRFAKADNIDDGGTLQRA